MLTEQVCYMKGVATPYVDRAGMLHEGVATPYVDRAGMLHEGSGHSIC